MLFFEGIAIPPAVQRLFLGVIDAANRANVSIYTMDAAGLRAESEQAHDPRPGEPGRRRRRRHPEPGRRRRRCPRRSRKTRTYSARIPHYGLGTLAQSTGGLIFDSTNNLRQAFDRVESDLRNYYLVGYTPSNDAYDGRFRNIDVKVKRPGVTVAARKGYFAVRDPRRRADQRVGSAGARRARAEAGAERVSGARGLAALPRTRSSRPRPGRRGSEDRATHVPGGARTARPTRRTSRSSSASSISRTQVVRKVSQHYEIQRPDRRDRAREEGEVLFYREPELPPGVYTMETVVYDALAAKSSVRLSTVEVPEQNASALRMSSLVLVKRRRKGAGEGSPRRQSAPRQGRHPLSEPRRSGQQGRQGARLLLRRLSGDGRRRPTATLELLRDGKLVAQLPMALPPPDASGRIQHGRPAAARSDRSRAHTSCASW